MQPGGQEKRERGGGGEGRGGGGERGRGVERMMRGKNRGRSEWERYTA